jgi:VCBS repeat-containing protein
LIAAAGGGFGGLLAGGAALAAAAAGGGGGGGGGAAAVVVVAAPTVEIEADSNQDSFVNKAEVDALTDKTKYTAKTTLPTSAVVGDTITVTDGTTTSTHVLTATDISNKFVSDTFAFPAEGSTITVTSKMTSAAGVSSANATDTAKLDTSAFVDPITPEPFTPTDPTKSGLRVTINSDENNDGILSNADMATPNLVKATIALTADSAVGDVLAVTATGNTTRTITLTAADIAAKQVVLKGLTAPAQGSTITVTATIQDAAANSSPSTATDSAKVDTTIPGVTIMNDENNDGFINKVESDKTTGVSVKIDVPSGAERDDIIKVSNGTTTINHPLTQAEVDAKSFTLTNAFVKPAEGATITVTAVLGTNTTGGSDSAKLDTSKFTDPVNPDPINPVDTTKSGLRVTINSDVNNDGFLSNSDLATADLVKATIALTTDAAVGDLLTVAITGNTTRTITLTAGHIAEKQVVLTGLTAPANGDTITVTATLQDVAGNSTPAVAFDSAKVNTAMPGVMITTDTNNDGLINSDELKGAATVTVRVEVPAFANADDFITVTDGKDTVSHKLSATDISNKSFEISNFFKSPADGSTITVKATIGTNEGTDSAKLDATAPTNANVGLGVSINTDGNNDAFVTASELGTSATFNSRATFTKDKVEVGDQIDFFFTNGSGTPVKVTHVLTATDVERGFVDKTFTKPAENTLQTVTVNFVDKAGNPATDTNTTTNPKLTDNATLDIAAPNNDDVNLGVRIMTDDAPTANGDGVVSSAELAMSRQFNGAAATVDNNNFISRATFDKTKAVVGHKIIFNASNGSTALAAQTITLTQADIDRGFVEVKFAKPSEDGTTQTVTAMYADAAGNADTTLPPTDFAKLDNLPPNDGAAPLVTITTDNGTGGAVSNGVKLGLNDGFVNDLEIDDSNEYMVEAEFDGKKVAVGDKVQFTAGSTVKEVVIDEAMKAANKVTTSFTAPTANGESFTVKVVIKDAVGNSTAENQDTVVRNKLEAANDAASVSASGSTNTVRIEGNVITGASGGAGKDIDTQFSGDKVFITGVKKGSATTFDPLSGTGSSGVEVVGEFGVLKIKADGSYTYELAGTDKVRKLIKDQKENDVFTYQVKDEAGNVSMATLTVEVIGVNDAPTISLNFTANFDIDAGAAFDPLKFGAAANPAIEIEDFDEAQAGFAGISKTGKTTLNLEYGDLTFDRVSNSTTSVGYSLTYQRMSRNGGTNNDSDTIRHDLLTIHSADGTKSETLDFAIQNSGGPNPDPEAPPPNHEFHTSSTAGLKISSASSKTKDTLVLEGEQLAFDFTGTVATTDIKSIETIDITGSGNNTIKLDMNSLTQADLSGGIHKLFIKGNDGDVVTFMDSSLTSITSNSTSVVDSITYNVFKIGDDELLVQSTIASVTVNG